MTNKLQKGFNKAPWLFYTASTIIYLVVFFIFINRISLDFIIHLDVWYRAILYNGFGILKEDFYNYAPAYMYLLAFATLLPVKSLWGIKLLSLPVIPLAGYFMSKMVGRINQDAFQNWLAYTLSILAPTILINSAYWGQADIFYGTASLACLSLLICKKPYAAMAAFGIAIAFKAQAVFLGPFLLLMLIKKQLPWKSILIPPLIFLLSGLPVFIIGKPINDIVLVYLKQANIYQSLCMNCSSLWALFPNANYDLGVWIGFVLTALVVLAYLIISYLRVDLANPKQLLLTAVLSAILMPFFLPKMLDRYFYMAELFSIGLIFIDWRYGVIPGLLQLSAANLYWAELRQKGYLFPVAGSTLMTVVAIGLLFWFFWRTTGHPVSSLQKEQDEPFSG